MLSEGRNYLAESPWMTLFPAMAVILTVVGINLLGDWLRDTFDPSLAKPLSDRVLSGGTRPMTT